MTELREKKMDYTIICTRCKGKIDTSVSCPNCDEDEITKFKSACIKKIENWHGDTYKELIYIHDAIEIINQTFKEYNL